MKTIFGDTLENFLEIGNEICKKEINFVQKNFKFSGFHQLLDHKNQKTIERDFLLKLPNNSSFLDIGANFGDTVLTMAIYAKNNNREDINFYAFEPNKLKCEFIEKIAKKNNLKIKIYNCCVGNINGYARNDNYKHELKGSCSYKICQKNKGINIIRLDDIQNELINIGLIHIDTEGWEIEVLKGAHNILNNIKNTFILICECWDDDVAKRQKNLGRTNKLLSTNPKKDILKLIEKYNYKRLEDIVDGETNLVFKIN